MMTDMFAMGVPLIEKVVRALSVYAFLLIAFRFAGKRLLAQLNPFDLVLLLIISNAVQNAIIGNDNSVVGGIVGAVTLLVANWTMVRLLYRFPAVETIIAGGERLLMDGGKVLDGALRAEQITKQELITAAHKQGVDALSEVKLAAIEPGGAIWFERGSPTPEDVRHREVMERLDRIERQLRG